MPVTCIDCGRQFARHYDLLRHQIPKINCPNHTCSKSFRFDKKNDFKAHIRARHAGQLDDALCENYFEAKKRALFPIPGVCIGATSSAERSSTPTSEAPSSEVPSSSMTSARWEQADLTTRYFGVDGMHQPSSQSSCYNDSPVEGFNLSFDVDTWWLYSASH
ncbi:hypothetical protein BGW36DRAFT_424495 [Talaromyces proteolyticus]|uniref:C2H2-type domain-containing protein n=1 Tax=Talaromyces proteolyticus TaxID=1131652 RepID=A0AAD4KZ52_9EURO|nr:uncharacterized protein BGW36DRAFT_424495 [Talaromyces proteolyticus]KAH8702212.1 hypothetical protein BGW36DRAFT_424495 [Talaromyces proteolyticus]